MPLRERPLFIGFMGGAPVKNQEKPESLRRFVGAAFCALLILIHWPFLLVSPPWLLGQFVVVLLVGFLKPVLAVAGIAILGPLFLRDPGSSFPILFLDVLILGPVLRWTPGLVGRIGRGQRSLVGSLILGMLILLLGSVYPSIMAATFKEDAYLNYLPLWAEIWAATILNPYATTPFWGLRSLLNFVTMAIFAFGVATQLHAGQRLLFFQLAGISLLISLPFALAGRFAGLDFSIIRPNHAEHGARLQGFSGHPGWYAQWFIVGLPVLILSVFRLQGRGRWLAIAATLFVIFALLLTGTRAAWIALVVVIFSSITLRWQTISTARLRQLAVLVSTVLALAIVAGFLVEDIGDRLTNLFRATDRARYYMTGFAFLNLHPWGIGLGTHAWFYGSRVPPLHPYWQFDHVDAHSLWLHGLVENGPLFLLFLMMLSGALLVGAFRTLRSQGTDQDQTLAVSFLVFAGLLVVAFFQNLVYIRIIEVALWFAGATMLANSSSQFKIPRWIRILLLAGASVAALGAMRHHTARPWPGEIGRVYAINGDRTFHVWTRDHFEMLVDGRASAVSMTFSRLVSSVRVTTSLGDEFYEPISLNPEEVIRKEYPVFPKDGAVGRFSPLWFRLEVEPLFTPALSIDGSEDERRLGVYLSDVTITFPVNDDSTE